MNEELLDLLRKLADLKEEIAELEERKRKVQDAVTAEMIVSETTKVDMEDGRSAVCVQPERTVIDEQRLKKKVQAAMWKKVTSVVLDKAKLEAAVDHGDVDIKTVAECAQIVPSTPYVKFQGRKTQ